MRYGIPKIKSNLPANARKIEPLDGFPIVIKNKEPFQARCTECLFEFTTSWDKLTNTSVVEHCNVCRYSKPSVSKFNSFNSDFKIGTFRHASELDKSVNVGKTGLPQYGVLATIIHLPCFSEQEFPLNNLKSIYRPSQSGDGSRKLVCDYCKYKEELQHDEAELKRLRNSPLIAKAVNIWGEGIIIEAISDGFWLEVPSFEKLFEPNKIPINAIIDPATTGRLKGQIKRHISEAMLSKLLKQDEDLISQVKDIQKAAVDFGATLKYVAYRGRKDNPDYSGSGDFNALPRKPGVYYQYEKATKHFSNWQTRFRARETNFGRTGIKADQLLIACAISEFFPYNEHGEPVEWMEDVRTVFKNQKELDIGSSNLLPHLGGVQIEYQGHQAHTDDPPTMSRDEEKRLEAKAKGHFFIQIGRVNHLCPQKALSSVKVAIDEYSGNEKNAFLEYVNPNPSVETIRQDYIDRLPDRAKRVTDRLLNYCEGKGHQLVTKKIQYLSSDDIEYKCGNCGKKHSSIVKTFIETDTRYCKNCKGEAIAELYKKSRETSLLSKLGELWDKLSDDLQYQLINNPVKAPLICPKCKKENRCGDSIDGVVTRLEKFSGFLCYHCLNTGEPQFPEGKTLGDYTQWEDTIIEIMKVTGWGQPRFWYKHISSTPTSLNQEYSNTEILVNLECHNGHKHCNTVRRWRTILNSKKRKGSASYCDICHPIKQGRGLADEEHLERLRRFHPNGEFLSTTSSALTKARCAEVSIIGVFKIEHPSFYIDIKKLKGRCKTKKNGEYSACLCCSAERSWAMPGGAKSLDALTARLQMRAAYVATRLGDPSISEVSVSTSGSTENSEVTTSEPLSFQCHIEKHPPTVSSHGNFFNAAKPGYCKICLKSLDAKAFRELTDKY